MNLPGRLSLTTLFATGFVTVGFSQVILDDTWLDGSRTEQNLPTESAWLESHDGILSSAVGAMTFTANPSSSRGAVTYFTDTPATPITLSDGQRITATLEFNISGMTLNNASSMRLGMFDYSGGTRSVEDIGSSGMNGAGVTGYATFTHISTTFDDGRRELDLKRRSVTSNTDLLGSSSAYPDRIGDAQAPVGTGSADGSFVMTLSVERIGGTAFVQNTLTGPGGLNLVASGTDATPYLSFDSFAFRNSKAVDTANSYEFTRFNVEVVTVPEPSTFALLGLGGLALALRRRS